MTLRDRRWFGAAGCAPGASLPSCTEPALHTVMRSSAHMIDASGVRLVCTRRAVDRVRSRAVPPPRRRPATSLAARTPSRSRRGLPASRTAGSTSRRRRPRAFPIPRRRSPIRFGPPSVSLPRHDRDHRSRPEGHEERPRPAGVAGTSTRARVPDPSRAAPDAPGAPPAPRARVPGRGARAKKKPYRAPRAERERR